jgi:cytochrome c peroxidase
LKREPIPTTNFSGFVVSPSAAIALGKALFWDMQAGGDGKQACASCHFNAGADSRTTGQVHPDAAGVFHVSFGQGANYTPSANDFPLHKLSDPTNRNSAVISDSGETVGSAGLYHTAFIDVVPGSASDAGQFVSQAQSPDVFQVGGMSVRRNTGKNTPPVVNAVFNFRNFWDGRAQNVFNGVNPSGNNDPLALVLQSTGPTSAPTKVKIAIANAALASQAVGPPNNPVEMSFDGRTWKKLGKKMLSLQPLAKQLVASDDSVLGPLSLAPNNGISASYAALIQQAFDPKWWNSNVVLDANGVALRDALGRIRTGAPSNTNEYSLMESNFSMFWGIAIQMYEATLVSDDSRFDRFMDGDRTALTSLEQQGLNIFQGKGGCTNCHMGPEFTDAAVANQSFAKTGVGAPVKGWHMIGVRPVADDAIIGAGAAKTPSLRNVEMTAPYFHNGGQLTLEQVIQFYSRGGDFGTAGVDLDSNMKRLGLSASDITAVAAFLRSLTDERVRNQSAPFDHPSIDIPNGADGTNLSVAADPAVPGKAADAAMLHLDATGRNGGAPLLRFADGLQ